MTVSLMEDEGALLAHFRDAVAEDLQQLAALQDREPTYILLEELKKANFPAGLGLDLQSTAGVSAVDFMKKVVDEWPSPIDKKLLDELAVDFAAIYLNGTLQASPQESVWLTDDQLTRQEPMFQVRKWYEKYELAAENWRARPDDHLVLQLQFLIHLFKLDDKKETLQEAATFLDEHLLRWVTHFASRVANHCETPFYAGVTVLTAQYLEELRDLLAQMLDKPRPSTEKEKQPSQTPIQFSRVIGKMSDS